VAQVVVAQEMAVHQARLEMLVLIHLLKVIQGAQVK
jgi:hypothetical protein